MQMRQKALEAMMGQDQPMMMGKAPAPMAQEEQEGMESILVTPEEKAMIMQLRGEPDTGSDIDGDGDEAPGQPMVG